MAICQPTHCFDLNGCDVLLHSTQKREFRNYPAPLCTNHIVRDWGRACDKVCHSRTIQKCFVRALRRDAKGDIDKSLIPPQIQAWYEANEHPSSDEEASDDVEWDE